MESLWIARAGRWVVLVLIALVGAEGPVTAEDPETWRDPHTSVASDGSVLSSYGVSAVPEGLSPFEGLGPLFVETGADFEGSGAALDGAHPVFETSADLEELLQTKSTIRNVAGGTIIGRDGRTRVNPTTSFPARATVLIALDGGSCTGWLYGPNIVGTAGHCVHSGGLTGRWYSNVRVYPGRNGSSSPYGFCRARTLYSVLGWTDSKNEEYDYGAIKLDCTVGNSTGWFGLWWQNASLSDLSATVAGYPGDKPQTPLTQWRSTGPVNWTFSRQIFYQHDTMSGQSGGPVYQNRRSGSTFCTGQCVMAIHAYGLHGIWPHSSNNHAVRITQSVFENLNAWKNAP